MTMLAEAETLIKENNALIGIANVEHVQTRYEEYLNMTEEDLNDMNKGDCITAQFALTQYVISINKQINWLNSKLSINTALYNRALAEVWDSYAEGFMSNDLRAACAANEYAHIREMHDEILKLKAVIDSMDGVVERVDGMIKIIKSLEFTKSKH